jgi:hypothetical protein
MNLISLSLLVNVLILGPVIVALIFNRAGVNRVFGERSTSREILLSMYFSIFVMSLWLLLDAGRVDTFAPPLLVLQIGYKLLSTVLITNKRAAVLWFNLAVAILHSITILSL